jgi:redox-sensitive bicupin YhaK (pirin superfamily)
MTRSPGDGPGTDKSRASVDVWDSREAVVGDTRVRRALPQRGRRTVGAWCFADHMGPLASEATPTGIGPHPHTGLHTVTWLVEGELLHRDSIGSEQAIRPGQLNVMTAGRGVSHAEEPTGRPGGGLHGIQLWVAQPEVTRHDPPAFEHHRSVPEVEVGAAQATVLVGALADVESPARRDTNLVGVDVRLRRGRAEVPVASSFEHAVVVLEGTAWIDGRAVSTGQAAYASTGRHQLDLATEDGARLLVLGGVPFEAPVVMWWNFVGRSRLEVADAGAAWNAGDGRFGETGSPMARIPAPRPPWGETRD